MPPITRQLLNERDPAGADVLRQLRPLQDELDALVARLSAGVRSHAQFDELDHQAHRIATGIRAAFRQRKRT
jgi:hypothetical protein